MYEYYLGPTGQEQKMSRVGLTVTPGEAIIGNEQRLPGVSAKLVRDVIARKRTWSLKYENLPGQEADTLDNGMGRDSLRSLYETGGELVFMTASESGIYESYTVLFAMGSFKDPRTQVEPFWRFSVEFELVEV